MNVYLYAALIAGLTIVFSFIGDYLIKKHRMRPVVVIVLTVGIIAIAVGLLYAAQSRALRMAAEVAMAWLR